MIDIKKLVEHGVHFGHQASRWSPCMEPYIWGIKDTIHLIDVSKTAIKLEEAASYLEKVTAEGKSILWIGTKKPAQESMYNAAQKTSMPYVTHRWIGGTLTNYSQVKKSVTRYLHYKDIVAKTDVSHYTKKELSTFQKIADRLAKNIQGIVNLNWPVGAIIAVDVRKEHSAIKEARLMNIPVVALIDTNGDPSSVDYVIPGNDDSPKSIRLIVEYLCDAVDRGRKIFKAKRKEEHKDDELLVTKKQVLKTEKDENLDVKETKAKENIPKKEPLKVAKTKSSEDKTKKIATTKKTHTKKTTATKGTNKKTTTKK